MSHHPVNTYQLACCVFVESRTIRENLQFENFQFVDYSILDITDRCDMSS